MDRGLGPPVKNGNGLINSAVSFIGYLVLYMFHISLQLTLLIIAGIIVLHPELLRIVEFDLLIGGLAILDIWLAKKL